MKCSISLKLILTSYFFTSSSQTEILLSTKKTSYPDGEWGTRKTGDLDEDIHSLARDISASEAEASLSNENMIDALNNSGNVSSVRDREAVLFNGTQNENERQV